MYRRVAASASAAVLAAAAAIPTLRQEQEEQESSLRRGLSSADGSSTLGDHGVGLACAVLNSEPVLRRTTGSTALDTVMAASSIDMQAAASAAGALAAMLLPTVHQMDALRNTQKGQHMGQRAAATA